MIYKVFTTDGQLHGWRMLPCMSEMKFKESLKIQKKIKNIYK